MIILNARFEDNVSVILNPKHIVLIKDYGDGAVISTTLNSRTGILHVKESKEEVLRMIQEETFYDNEF
nr:MAG TPA: Flagellar and Swarming motility protein [Caudoviricetes sp.]